MMVVVVMGVAGSGKSTLVPLLAAALGGDHAEGDKFHPPANIAKMTRGEPLNDEDRRPWLEAMADAIVGWRGKDRPTVLACSALRRRYREMLARGSDEVKFVYLRVTPELVAERMSSRKGHFMPTSLISSQFATLEEPDDAIVLDGREPPQRLVETAVRQLRGGTAAAAGDDFDTQSAALTAELLAGNTEPGTALFATRNQPAPSARWNPSRDDLPTDSLKFLLDYWNRLRGDLPAPAPRAIDPVAMRPILGNVLLIDVEPGDVFRYALYGARLVDVTAFDWTGRTTRDMAAATRMPGPIFYDACYRAVVARRAPLLTFSHGAPALAIKTWARLVLPLGDPVARLLVGNVPVVRNPGLGDTAGYAEELRRFFDTPR